MEEDIHELDEKSIVFQLTKCELCRQPLELPAIYFMCKHAYHSKCLGDLTGECPKCGPEYRLIQEMLRSQSQQVQQYDVLIKKVVKFNLVG